MLTLVGAFMLPAMEQLSLPMPLLITRRLLQLSDAM
jgi:hypothetical protein